MLKDHSTNSSTTENIIHYRIAFKSVTYFNVLNFQKFLVIFIFDKTTEDI